MFDDRCRLKPVIRRERPRAERKLQTRELSIAKVIITSTYTTVVPRYVRFKPVSEMSQMTNCVDRDRRSHERARFWQAVCVFHGIKAQHENYRTLRCMVLTMLVVARSDFTRPLAHRA